MEEEEEGTEQKSLQVGERERERLGQNGG